MTTFNTFEIKVNEAGKPELYLDGIKLKGLYDFCFRDSITELPTLSVDMYVEYKKVDNNEPS